MFWKSEPDPPPPPPAAASASAAGEIQLLCAAVTGDSPPAPAALARPSKHTPGAHALERRVDELAAENAELAARLAALEAVVRGGGGGGGALGPKFESDASIGPRLASDPSQGGGGGDDGDECASPDPIRSEALRDPALARQMQQELVDALSEVCPLARARARARRRSRLTRRAPRARARRSRPRA